MPKRKFRIPVVVHVIDQLEVNPSEIVLVRDSTNRAATRYIEISAGRTKKFKIIAVEMPSKLTCPRSLYHCLC